MKNRNFVLTRERLAPPVRAGIKAHHVTLEVVSPRGVVTQVVEEHNTILDQGMDAIAVADPWSLASSPAWGIAEWCALGEGVDSDDEEDVGLASEFIRRDREVVGGQSGVARVADGHYRVTRHIEFLPAEVEGRNITTVGFSHATSAGDNLNFKIVLPEVVTVPQDYYLRVLYAIDYSWDVTPIPLSINISGLGTITGHGKWIAGNGASSWNNRSVPSQNSSRDMCVFAGFTSFAVRSLMVSHRYEVHRSDHSALGYTSPQPNPATDPAWGNLLAIPEPYVPGSHERVFSLEIGLGHANNDPILGIGLGAQGGSSIRGAAGFFLTFPGTPITKDDEHILRLNDFKISWARE